MVIKNRINAFGMTKGLKIGIVVILVVWLIGSYFLFKWYSKKKDSETPATDKTPTPSKPSTFTNVTLPEVKKSEYWWEN